MAEIPRAVLSEQFQDRMKGRRLVSALFTTFRFDPGFFETEILPVFFDMPLSHAGPIKLVQMEEALSVLPGSVAVYYDQNGLVPEGEPAKLDIRRFPIRHRSGIFHPKNVFALVEDVEPDDQGEHARALLCACLSANLTEAGWWKNVEVAHVEEIGAGEHTSLRDSLVAYVDRLVTWSEGRRANDELRENHVAVRDIRKFLAGAKQRDNRSVQGRLCTQFDDGKTSLPDFLHDAAGSALRGMCLEIISPYFDSGGESKPLAALIEKFRPREVRVYLPRNDSEQALCPEDLFTWVRGQEAVSWGALPADLLRLGKGDDTKRRTVHAKVYRFFEPTRGGREILYVGSTNLTEPGCRLKGRGGNWESGFLVEVPSGAQPDWWLAVDARKPKEFAPKREDEGTASSGGTQLVVRYRWDRDEAAVLWGGEGMSPALSIQHDGVQVFAVADLPPAQWVDLPRADVERLAQTLASTSLLDVTGETTKPGVLLVQEEGMSHRPSVLLDLTAGDILRYWALLTVEQRAAFIEARARVTGDDDPLLAKLAPLPVETTLFDRFAGVFHAFGCLEERVRDALDDGKTREADYRLFGKKYDSLGNLLGRVLSDVKAGSGDRVEQYVVTLCARQLLTELGRGYREYWSEHAKDIKELEAQLRDAASLRKMIAESHADMPAFLDWFERWFLKRAEAPAEEETS